MLTADLVRSTIEGETIRPRYITRKQAAYYLKVAAELTDLIRQHAGKPRRELEEALIRLEGSRVGYKIFRGLASIVLKSTEFRPEQELDFPALRLQLFAFAEQFRPIIQTSDLLHQASRETVLQAYREQFGGLPRDLYGDLPEAHLLCITGPFPDPEAVLRRYNLALAQGLLYHCVRMQVRLWDSFKVVLRYLKLAGLMHHIMPEGESYRILVDGPVSLFQRTRRYGVNMSRFLPGLLLAQKWQMLAEISTPSGEKRFYLDQNCGLSSHYGRDDPFDSKVEAAFHRQFCKRKTEWHIEREGEIVDLGDTVLIPDFRFVHPDGRTGLLEIVGFWTPEYLQKKIDKINRAKRDDLLIAVNEKLNCSRDSFHGPVIFYKTRVKVKEVLAWLENRRSAAS